MRDEEIKKWWQSQAIIGGIIAVASACAGLVGIVIDTDTQVQLADLFIVMSTAAGGMLAIIGRIKASRKIK